VVLVELVELVGLAVVVVATKAVGIRWIGGYRKSF
jgi:hypothetical protein